ncbi:MAG: hypothetical protein ACPG7W_00095 [Paracoccaceae bacterium]
MALKRFGTGIGSAVALSAALAALPDRAKAQDFGAYCAPLANGEVLESELTPQNMGYIFDAEGQVVGARADELTAHFGMGLSEACGIGDVGAYIAQYGQRVMLELYPPQIYPLGMASEVMAEIEARYASCLAEELAAVDDNANQRLDPGEDAAFYREGEAHCNQELQSDMQHAGQMARLNTKRDQIYARLSARTEAIIAGARRQAGL